MHPLLTQLRRGLWPQTRVRCSSRAVLLLLCTFGAAAAWSQEMQFDIPPQALDSALLRFAEQANAQVSMSTHVGNGIKTLGVSGKLVPQAALASLLAHTGLQFKAIGERTYSISKLEPAGGGEEASPSAQVGGEAETQTTGSGSRPLQGQASAEQSGGSESIHDVVVTATRTELRKEDVPASIATVDLSEARVQGFSYGTDEFRGVTGIFFRRGEGDADEFSYVSIRGSTGTDGYLPMLDGVPLIGAEEEPLLFLVPYDAVERIEIVKGPASALYGRGALYGAVNYITQSPTADARKLSFGVGNDNDYRVDGSLSRRIGDDSGLLLNASYENNEGWRAQSAREIVNVFGKFTHDFTERTALTAYANYSDRQSELPSAVPLAANGEVIEVAGGSEGFLGYGDPRNDQQVLVGALRLEHEASDSLTFTASAQGRSIDYVTHWNFYDPFGFAPSENIMAVNGFEQDARQTIWYAETTANWHNTRHNLVTGVSVERGKMDADDRWSGQYGFTPACGFTFFEIQIDYTTGQVLNRDHPCFLEDVLYNSHHFDNRFWGAFIQDEIRLTDQLFFTVGGRYDHFERTARFDPIEISTSGGTTRAQADAFAPKASLSWRYDGGQAYFTFGRGFNSNFGPTFEWDASQYLRPTNKPSTLDNYELGWKGRVFDDIVSFEAALFYLRQTNRRSLIPNPDAATDPTAPGRLITFGQLYSSRGAEIAVRVEPTDRTSFTLNYSYIKPEWEELVVSTFAGPVDLSGMTPTGVPRHMGYLAIDHRFAPWLTARMSFEAYDDYMITQDNRVEAGSYELLNLSAHIEPDRWTNVSLDLALTNVLDEEYYFYFGGRTAPTYATPGVPRHVRATLRWSF